MHKHFSIFLVLVCLFTAVQSGAANALNAIYLTEPTKAVDHKPSVMVVSRDENRTVVTLAPRFSYDGTKLGILVPVPNISSKTQIRFANPEFVAEAMRFTSPRFNYYNDGDICVDGQKSLEDRLDVKKSDILPFTFDYVDAPDIRIIKSDELAEKPLGEILKEAGFSADKVYDDVLASYKAANVEFVLLTLNQALVDDQTIPPLQIAYESDNFTLPLGLSAMTGGAAQDLTLIFISRDGLVQPKSVGFKKMPTDLDIPLFVKSDFAAAYNDIFGQAVTADNFQSAFLEFSGDVAWCPNCKDSNALDRSDLRALGAWWVDRLNVHKTKTAAKPKAAPTNVYMTRMHIRHTNKTLQGGTEFVSTKDKSRFQVAFNMHQPFVKAVTCEDGRLYQLNLPKSYEAQIYNYAALTGQKAADIRAKMEEAGQSFALETSDDSSAWWERMWNIPAEKANQD